VSIAVSSKVTSFEEYLLAAEVRKRRGLTRRASGSLVNNWYLVSDDRKRGSVEQPPYHPHYAVIGPAIQLNLITTEQAQAPVENGKTLNEWIIEQSVEIDGPEAGRQKKRLYWLLWLVSLLFISLVMWAGLGWIVLRVVRSLL
jgi:hypothetical protein